MRVCVHLLYDSIQHTLSGGTYILRLTCPTRADLLVNSLLICATVVVGAAEARKKEGRGEIVDTYYVRSLHAAAACCSYVGVLFSLGLLSVRRCLLWMCLCVCVYEHTQVRGSVELELPVRFVQKKQERMFVVV